MACGSGSSPTPEPAYSFARVEHFSGVLPASGAFSAQSFQALPEGTKRVTYWVKYTPTVPNGRFTWRHESGNLITDEGRDPIQDNASLAPSGINGVIDIYAEQPQGPSATAGGEVQSFQLTYVLGADVRFARLLVAEAGETANPGSIVIGMTADAGGAQ